MVDLTKPSTDAPHVRTLLELLETRYGRAELRPPQDPLDELVACILSQHTSDVNSLRAFRNLRDVFPAWQDVVDATPDKVADAIRRGGLADSKAARIQNVLVKIRERFGDYKLDALADMAVSEAREYLISLPGVGPKTAAIVLCFALGHPVIPVDTHVFRVAWRLGLIEKRVGEAKAHDLLQAMVPDDIIYRFHVALIQHGRQVCKAPRPKCAECPVAALCRYAAEHASELSL